MWAGVAKSGSPRLKSKTLMPAAFIWRALAPAARVAEGWTLPASLERRIIAVGGSQTGGPRRARGPGHGETESSYQDGPRPGQVQRRRYARQSDLRPHAIGCRERPPWRSGLVGTPRRAFRLGRNATEGVPYRPNTVHYDTSAGGH